MLSLDENPLLLAGDFILGAPKPGYGVVNLYWGYNQGHQKDLLMTERRDTAELTPSLDSDSIRLVSKLFLTNNALYRRIRGG